MSTSDPTQKEDAKNSGSLNEKISWLPIFGDSLEEQRDDTLIFKGGLIDDPTNTDDDNDSQKSKKQGLYMSKHLFTGGTVEVKVEFEETHYFRSAEIVLSYDPRSGTELPVTLNAGIPDSQELFSIRQYDPQLGNWTYFVSTGNYNALRFDKLYHLLARVQGSVVWLKVDGVVVLKKTLQKPFTQSQIGLYLASDKKITIRDFKMTNDVPKAFVIMQFSLEYQAVYFEVKCFYG